MNSNPYDYFDQQTLDDNFEARYEESSHDHQSHEEGEFLTAGHGKCMYYKNMMCTHPILQKPVMEQPMMYHHMGMPCGMEHDLSYLKDDEYSCYEHEHSYDHNHEHEHSHDHNHDRIGDERSPMMYPGYGYMHHPMMYGHYGYPRPYYYLYYQPYYPPFYHHYYHRPHYYPRPYHY